MTYRLSVPKAVQKQLDALPQKIHRRVSEHILALTDNPRPPGCIKLKGYKDQYRIRIGDYRVLYEIDDRRQLVSVRQIRHRREAYR